MSEESKWDSKRREQRHPYSSTVELVLARKSLEATTPTKASQAQARGPKPTKRQASPPREEAPRHEDRRRTATKKQTKARQPEQEAKPSQTRQKQKQDNQDKMKFKIKRVHFYLEKERGRIIETLSDYFGFPLKVQWPIPAMQNNQFELDPEQEITPEIWSEAFIHYMKDPSKFEWVSDVVIHMNNYHDYSTGQPALLMQETYVATNLQTQSPYASNLDLNAEAGYDTVGNLSDDILDFTERNPFGEVDE